MTEKQITNYITELKAQSQLTGEKVEAIQIGNDCFVYVNDERYAVLECI